MNGLKHIKAKRYRSVWISDVHLGFRGCRADYLLEFLHAVECDYLYLVGDIIDLWAMKRRWYWPQAHNNVIRSLLGKAKHGTQVIFVPGNHDEIFRDYDGMTFGNVKIVNQTTHETADGRRLLILHGDEFDAVVTSSHWVSVMGSVLYDWLLRTNIWINFLRRHLGFPYWSMSAFLKGKVKNAVQYISRFEEVVAHQAKISEVDGVVCGHIHRAEISQLNGVTYHNCGDWVESCTALTETADGRIELLRWLECREQYLQPAADWQLKNAA